MRLKNYFTVPAEQKITERQMRRVLVSSICSILLCMSCLVGTTWAWYSYDISSTGNVIQLGVFNASFLVKNEKNEKNEVVYPVDVANGFNYNLVPGEYVVYIVRDPNNTAAGYCNVILDGVEYGTVPIPKDGKEVSFTVKISEPEVSVVNETEDKTDDSKVLASILKILPAWGTLNSEDTLLGASENMSIEGTANTFVDIIAAVTEPEKETASATEESTTTMENSDETTAATENPTEKETPATTVTTDTTENATTTEINGETDGTTAATEEPTEKETTETTVTTDTTENATTTATTEETDGTTAATEEPTEKETPATTESTDTAE